MQDFGIARVVEHTELSNAVAMGLMLYSLPRCYNAVEALAVMPGMGETWRVSEGIKAWQCPESSALHLLVAGISDGEETFGAMTLEGLALPPYWLHRTSGVELQVNARHTVDQVDWLVERIKELGVESLALFVSPYHLLRAYCTLLKAFKRHSVPWIQLIPAPVMVPPAWLIPESQANSWDSVPGEVRRILAYQAKGDVATYDELRSYLGWLWQQPLLRAAVTTEQPS